MRKGPENQGKVIFFSLQIMENHGKKLTFQPTLITLSVAFLIRKFRDKMM